MKVAKDFRWEAAHRLPRHQGACRHLHGHSYRMTVELSGPVGSSGMVVDFQEIKAWLRPLVQAWDHATLVCADDTDLLDVVRRYGWKHVVLPDETTAENLCLHALAFVEEAAGSRLTEIGATRIRVRIMETETCYAEMERTVGPGG